jgi:glycosyltransferase involved in cell wall biosynthesis
MPTQFSVITVCYNAASCIQPTIESLAAQTWPHIEYIVVDGLSKDGTQAIVQGYGDRINTFVSEKDKGIFDAMNKGIALATGDVLFFLNADDAYCDPEVLADVAQCFDADPALDMVYGNVILTSGSARRQRSFHWVNARNIYYGDLCHQVVFARRSVFERLGGFDLKLPTDADYDWLLRVFHSGAKARYIDRDITYFAEGGFHTQNAAAHEQERWGIKTRFRPAWRVWLGYWLLRAELKVRKLMGQSIA